MNLLLLDDDTLVLIFGFLPVSSIILLRQTCQRLASISKLRFIWRQACIDQVLSKGYPFPASQLANAPSVADLEQQVIRSLRLGAFWTSSGEDPLPRSLEFQASTGTGVSHVRFLSGHGGRYLVTVYKGIWSMISCWYIGDSLRSTKAHKVGDWCPKNTIFSGFVVNSDPESAAALAVAVQHGGGTQSIEVLSVANQNGTSCFQPLCSIATTFRPIALRGELIAFSDDGSETVVMNWHENTFALLKGSQRPIDERFQYNRCLQVVFAYKSILVVRARTVELFPEPELRPTDAEHATYQPIGSHSFGWIDGVAVNSQSEPLIDIVAAHCYPRHEPLSIILRAESDDPWASDVHKLEQFVLAPNPAFECDSRKTSSSGTGLDKPETDSPRVPHAENTIEPPAPPPAPVPYLFPPVRAEHTSPTVRGFLRCRDIALGRAGTALWIQPRAARTAHLTGLDVHSSSTQVADGMNPDFQHPDDAPLTPHDPLAPVLADVGSGGLASAGRNAESLCAAVFAGPLQRLGFGCNADTDAEAQTRTKTLCVQRKEGCNWTAFDYDEEGGRVALGSSDGSVTVLNLV